METAKTGGQGNPPSAAQAEKDLAYRTGVGNWSAFHLGMDAIYASARKWREKMEGVPRAWLCWNVDPDWCLVQQRLAASVGWTPLVGSDPRAEEPRLVPGAVQIDFNADFHLPTMWMHFPLEFAFLFAERLAFWHSDLLVRREKLQRIAENFAALPDGSMTVSVPRRGLRETLFKRGTRRYWELIGCTTRGASRSQFEQGCGWWMNFAAHPNCPGEDERLRRKRFYWDHGAGILYWAEKCGGQVAKIKEAEVEEGHCTRISNVNYQRLSPDTAERLLPTELRHNFSLVKVCRDLGLEDLLKD